MATNSKFIADLGIKTDADLQIGGNTTIDGNATVSGNLTVNGTSLTVNATTTSVEDNMLELANANTSSDTLDIGIYGNYDDGLSDGGATEYTGLFRDASDSTWKLFDGLEVAPTTTVNTSGTGYTLADLTVGDLTATTLTATNGLTGSSITYPTSDGTSGQVIKTDGSGDLSFGNVSLDSLSDCTISASTPNSTTNPPYAGAMWIEEDTGDVYVCTNATTDNNTWVKTGSADGITTSGSNTIIQSPDDTNVIHVNNSAEVGIGTNSPAAKLDVKGSYSSPQALIGYSDGDGVFIHAQGGPTHTNWCIGQQKNLSGLEFTPSTTAGGTTFSNPALSVHPNGDIGVGAGTPDFSGFGSNGGGLELDDVGSSFTAVKVSQGSTGNLYLAASTGAGYLWQHSNSPLIIGTNNAERIRIQDGTGRMGINSAGIAYSSSEKLSLYNDNFGFGIKAAYTGMGIWNTESSGGYIAFAYGSGGAAGGSISYSGGTTSYNTSSDYRLKENVDYTWDATTRLKQLKPARFNWISDDTDTLIDGFLAHEVSSIVPEAVTGEKDAVYTAEEAENSAGAEAGDIKVQVMDNAKLVPLLVKTIQELEARITTLESA